MVLDPAGTVIGGPLSDAEGIIYAEIDTALSVEPKQFHDVVGYYNRFDIFDFHVDRTRREPATYREELQADRTETPRLISDEDTTPRVEELKSHTRHR